MADSKGPRLYRSDEAPGTPQQGDIIYRVSNGRLEQYTGTAWGAITFNNVTAQTTTVAGLTADSVTVSAGMASLNSTSPAFYIPVSPGIPVGGGMPSLSGRAAIAYNSTSRAIVVSIGGSWFTTTVSLAIA